MKKIIVAILMLCSFTVMAQVMIRKNDPGVIALKNEKDTKVLEQKLAAMRNGSESEMEILSQYYGQQDMSKMQEVIKEILAKYPQGKFAVNQRIMSITFEKDPLKKESALLDAKRNFPNANLDQFNGLVAIAFASSDTNKAWTYFNEVKHPLLRAITLGKIQESILRKDVNAALALATKELPATKKLLTYTAPTNENVLVENSFLVGTAGRNTPKDLYYNLIFAYGRILLQAGKNEEALKYIDEVYTNIGKKDDLLSKQYGLALCLTGKYKQALPILEELVKKGQGDERINQALKTAYGKINVGKDANAYLSSLDASYKMKYREEIKKLAINLPSPNFALKDVDGKTVTLADYKGKTIIVDFWATWCGPCKASFPAMQLSVNKYKNDPNVKFLFVHTLEKVADPLSDARNYLKTNNYDFDLFMDLKDPETKKNPVVSAFGVSGIPTKFIIDSNSNIRFKVVGFNGDTKGAVDEVNEMIEIARGKGI